MDRAPVSRPTSSCLRALVSFSLAESLPMPATCLSDSVVSNSSEEEEEEDVSALFSFLLPLPVVTTRSSLNKSNCNSASNLISGFVSRQNSKGTDLTAVMSRVSFGLSAVLRLIIKLHQAMSWYTSTISLSQLSSSGCGAKIAFRLRSPGVDSRGGLDSTSLTSYPSSMSAVKLSLPRRG